MRIGIIGTGRMGSTLGRLWAQREHHIYFGSRTPEKAQQLAQEIGYGVQGGSLAAAAAFARVLLLAVPWQAVPEILPQIATLQKKILIDITIHPQRNGGPQESQPVSAAEEIAVQATWAWVVKSFNYIHDTVLEKPIFRGERASMFYCGDDPASKAVVAQLGFELGFEPVDVGPLSMARQLEPLGHLWTHLAFEHGFGPDIAFKLLHR